MEFQKLTFLLIYATEKRRGGANIGEIVSVEGTNKIQIQGHAEKDTGGLLYDMDWILFHFLPESFV